MSLGPSYTLHAVVDAGYAPSIRWLAEGIKAGRIPGRIIGRYWRNWRMTEADVQQFLSGAAAPSAPVPVVEEPVSIAAGLSAASRRRLRSAS